MTNLEQVKNLLSITGSASDLSITDWLIAGGRVIAELTPADKLSQFSTVETAATSYDLTNKKFISINSTNGSHFIPTTPDIFTRSSTVGSIYKTIADGNQYYTIDGDLLKVTVIANSLKTYTYPTVASENVTNLPNQYIHGAVLYAASNAITKLVKDTTYVVSQTTLTLPTLPSEPTLVYEAVSDIISIDNGTLATVAIADYIAPTLVLNNINALLALVANQHIFNDAITPPTLATISYSPSAIIGPVTVDIASVTALLESFTGTFTIPTISFALDMGAITLPTNIDTAILDGILSTDASASVVNMTTAISELDTYFSNLDNTTTGYINGLEDVELAQSKMNEIQVKLKEIETELSSELQKQTKTVELATDVSKTNKAQALSGLIQKADAYLKRYSAELQKFQAHFTRVSNQAQLNQQGELARLKGEIDVQTGKFNEKMTIFKTATEKVFEQAKIDLQRVLQLSNLTTDINHKNAAAAFQALVGKNEILLKDFSAKLEQWVQNETIRLGKIKTNIDFYLSDNQSKIQDFQVREAIALNTFNTALSEVKENYQKDLAIISLNVQKAIKKVEIETDIKKQNALQVYIASYNTFQEKMSRFAQDVNRLQINVQRDMALINSNIQNNESEKQKLMGLQKSLIEQFNNFIAMMFPRQQAQPQQEGQ